MLLVKDNTAHQKAEHRAIAQRTAHSTVPQDTAQHSAAHSQNSIAQQNTTAVTEQT